MDLIDKIQEDLSLDIDSLENFRRIGKSINHLRFKEDRNPREYEAWDPLADIYFALVSFSLKQIEFSDWKDLCETGLRLFSEVIYSLETASRKFESPKQLSIDISDRWESIRNSDKYPWWYFTPEHGN